MAQKSKIGALEAGAYHPVYRRSDGTTWLKMNEMYHVPTENRGDYWSVAGDTAKFDPEEEVEVLHLASEQKA